MYIHLSLDAYKFDMPSNINIWLTLEKSSVSRDEAWHVVSKACVQSRQALAQNLVRVR
jgi:hypothetical protein